MIEVLLLSAAILLPPLGSLFQNISVFTPIGQSFTPTLTSLNFVNVMTQESGFTAPFTLEVNI